MPATASEKRRNSRVREAYRQTVTGAPDEQALAAIMAQGSGVFRGCPFMSS